MYRVECKERKWSDDIIRPSFPLAVKEIHLDKTQLSIEDIQKEITTLGSLRHENIVRYYTSFTWQKEVGKGKYANMLWMVMNLAEKGSALDALMYRTSEPEVAERHPEDKVGHYDDSTIATILRDTLMVRRRGNIYIYIYCNNKVGVLSLEFF